MFVNFDLKPLRSLLTRAWPRRFPRAWFCVAVALEVYAAHLRTSKTRREKPVLAVFIDRSHNSKPNPFCSILHLLLDFLKRILFRFAVQGDKTTRSLLARAVCLQTCVFILHGDYSINAVFRAWFCWRQSELCYTLVSSTPGETDLCNTIVFVKL